MSGILILEQTLNGLQFGLMLFLLAAGLTLVFGIMDMINLAHGSLYMVGAYLMATFVQATGSFVGSVLAVAGTALSAWRSGSAAAPLVSARPPDAGARDLRLDSDATKARPQPGSQPVHTPAALSGPVSCCPASPTVLPADHRGRDSGRDPTLCPGRQTHRHGACQLEPRCDRDGREHPHALHDRVGVAQAARSPARCSPILAVQVGMGENILILAFVVIVVGSIG
jgi:branched-chain amino acid transport system permease protein